MTQHTRASTSPEPGGAGSDFSFQAPNLSKLATGDQEEGEVLEEKQQASMPERRPSGRTAGLPGTAPGTLEARRIVPGFGGAANPSEGQEWGGRLGV